MRYRAILSALTVVALTILDGNYVQAADTALEIHAAPNGNDANPGTATRPLATIEAARLHARKLARQISEGQVRVVIHGGTYRIRTAATTWRTAARWSTSVGMGS